VAIQAGPAALLPARSARLRQARLHQARPGPPRRFTVMKPWAGRVALVTGARRQQPPFRGRN